MPTVNAPHGDCTKLICFLPVPLFPPQVTSVLQNTMFSVSLTQLCRGLKAAKGTWSTTESHTVLCSSKNGGWDSCVNWRALLEAAGIQKTNSRKHQSTLVPSSSPKVGLRAPERRAFSLLNIDLEWHWPLPRHALHFNGSPLISLSRSWISWI